MSVRVRWVMAGLGLCGVVAGLAWQGWPGLGVAAGGLMVYLLAAFT